MLGIMPLIPTMKNGLSLWQGLNGGDMRDRTADLLNANQTLSQLSYVPIFYLVNRVGIEPTTKRLRVSCSTS